MSGTMREQEQNESLTDENSTGSTFQDLLTDLSYPSRGGRNANVRTGTSQGPPASPWLSSPRSPSSRQNSMSKPYNYLSRRRSSNSRVVPVASYDHPAGTSPSLIGASTFPNPNRSIFTSSQPTSSVSASTAHASMSSPSQARESRPLAAFSGSASFSRRPNPQALQRPLTLHRSRITAPAEKDADDPTVAMDEPDYTRRTPITSAALSQLFVNDSSVTPGGSRSGSYLRTLNGPHFNKHRQLEGGALAPHVYGQGLLGGKFSDVTVHAFGTAYNLHRLLLDRAPFFSTAFSGPWLEANSKEMRLDPADVDSNITQAAFELALKRLYGCEDPEEEDQEAIGLFAVACWLEMSDLLEASIESLLRQMTPAKLATNIRFVTGNYYGTAGSRILNSAKAMLCRDGWRMKLKFWDAIPAEIIKDIVGSDGFFVIGEWERWSLAKRLLNKRLKSLARDTGMVNANGKVNMVPKRLCVKAIREVDVGSDYPTSLDKWTSLYSHPEITPLHHLIDKGIHYVHMSFEELQRIRSEKDVFGIPMLPEKVISAALWMQMELRQKVVNADDADLELGLVEQVNDTDAAFASISSSVAKIEPEEQFSSDDIENIQLPSDASDTATRDESLATKAAGKRRESAKQIDAEAAEAVQRDEEKEGPSQFWVPTADATFPVGDVTEAQKSNRTTGHSQEDVYHPEDTLISSSTIMVNDVGGDAPVFEHRLQRQGSQSSTGPGIATAPSPPIAYTYFPPYRFSVEFPAAAMLKENKRFYSNTIWYAGSLWNVYVQKKESTRGLQLGVYLHREKQTENREIMLANYAAGHSVDERIGHLERELENRKRVDRRTTRDGDIDTALHGSGTDLDTTSGTINRPSRRATKKFVSASHSYMAYDLLGGIQADEEYGLDSDSESDEESTIASASPLLPAKSRSRMPVLPPYGDSRPTIRTYFKIYTPSKDGRVLTVYESKPDKFNFSQSWGWKSGGLDIDEDCGHNSTREGGERRLQFMITLGAV